MQDPENQPFDRALRVMRRDRAAKGGFETFLLADVCARLLERLEDVNRDFPRTMIVGAGDGTCARGLLGRFGVEQIEQTEASPLLAALAAEVAPCRVADEEFLDLPPETYDLIIAPLTLHSVNDLPGALIQIRRALKPDGMLLAALFAGETLRELRTAMTEAEIETTGGLSPRFLPMADLRDLGGLLQRAGLALPVADRETIAVRYGEPLSLMRDLRAMGETNVMVERRREPIRRAMLHRAMEIYGRDNSDPDGRIRATFEIAFLHGWAPHESQQKPLRPGSAAARLADALGTAEQALNEKAGR